ncbi:MAG TPA: hypothetical protein VH328_10370, partial [Burkholderiaceae bacterium]|nr:hypothetical protein [Burkholderiaceae bacterium]
MLLAVCLVYGRLFFAGFVRFDDDLHVYANPFLNPPTLHSLERLWQHAYEHLYVPLAYTIYAVLASLAQVAVHVDASIGQSISVTALPFHVASVALHALNVWLCFCLVRRLTDRPRVPWLCALVFALHPLQLESVAWISELRGVSSASLVLLALNVFVSSRQAQNSPRRAGLLAVAAVSLLAATLCKPSAAAVPLVALAIDRVALRTPWRKALLAASVLALVVVPFVMLTRASQVIPAAGQSSPWQRPFVAGDALAFYVLKTVLPIDLGVDYGRTPASVMAHGWSYLVWLLPGSLLAVAFVNRQRRPLTWLGLLMFVCFLLPTSGLMPFSFQAYSTVADRYAYLALLGVGLVVADVIDQVK